MAPQFATQAIYGDQSRPIKLSDYRGQIVALYLYPKDFTPGCTTEACTFRDSYATIKKAGIVLLGCSVDTADSHRAFIKKYGLPFPLLLDPDKKIAAEYGVANGIAKYGLDGRVTYLSVATGGSSRSIQRLIRRSTPRRSSANSAINRPRRRISVRRAASCPLSPANYTARRTCPRGSTARHYILRTNGTSDRNEIDRHRQADHRQQESNRDRLA